MRVDKPRTGGEIAAVQELRRRHFHRARIGDITVNVRESELHRLDREMLHGGGIDRLRAEFELLQDPQCHQGGDPLAVGRNFVHGDAAIVQRNRVTQSFACAAKSASVCAPPFAREWAIIFSASTPW